MKRILLLILIIILVGFLVGCDGLHDQDLYNLNGFILPSDEGFINLVEELQFPRQICQYIHDNFTYEAHFYDVSPYELYQTKKGDCNDFSSFVVFILNYNFYETYQIAIYYPNSSFLHYIAVFKEGKDKLNFTSNWSYFEIAADNFEEIVNYLCFIDKKIWSKYIVYDHGMNIVEKREN
jgi:hypothetical protein